MRGADRKERWTGIEVGNNRPNRLARVSAQLQDEIATMMRADIKDPRVRMATVTGIKLSPDLHSARVMVSAVGTQAERHGAVSALRHAEGYIRGELRDRLENLKTIPHMIFELDESIEYSIHINSVLKTLEAPQQDSDHPGDTEPAPDETQGKTGTGEEL